MSESIRFEEVIGVGEKNQASCAVALLGEVDVLVIELKATGCVEQRHILDWRTHARAEAVRMAIWMADGWFAWAREQWGRSGVLNVLAGKD